MLKILVYLKLWLCTDIIAHFFFNLSENADNGSQFRCGQEVKVVGASPRRGFLIVQGNDITHHVPYSLLDLKVSITP